ASIEVVFADQGYTGDPAARRAAEMGVELVVVKRPEGEKGFVLLPRRWVVERSFAWLSRFRRLGRDLERLGSTLLGFHFAVSMAL
ncbi:transposase, partial [Deinococcus sp. SM5_A1]|uniref:transposase n=1 Tax=Deinococcus sp. SM5_A1 TaxID=3379094 RepID=UPI00385949FB